MKLKRKILVAVGLSLTVCVIAWYVWIRETPNAAFLRVTGMAPPPSVTEIRATHGGGMQTWYDTLTFRIAPHEFPLLLEGRPFTQVPKIDDAFLAEIEEHGRYSIANPIYFETPELINGEFQPIYIVRTNPERTSVLYLRVDGQ